MFSEISLAHRKYILHAVPHRSALGSSLQRADHTGNHILFVGTEQLQLVGGVDDDRTAMCVPHGAEKGRS
jgi:hypothetical protein